jgi:hypothetical protein
MAVRKYQTDNCGMLKSPETTGMRVALPSRSAMT